MDSTIILFGITYILATIALAFAVYACMSYKEIEKELNDTKKRQSMSAWNYYHDKAKEKPVKKNPNTPFNNI